VQDLGLDSEDETKVAAMGIKGASYIASFISQTSSTIAKVVFDGRKIKDVFHL
jgi:hypothetical protein